MNTIELLKVAWIRNPAPMGVRAKGHLNCSCCHAPESEFDALQKDIVCKCGKVYHWDGTLVSPLKVAMFTNDGS